MSVRAFRLHLQARLRVAVHVSGVVALGALGGVSGCAPTDSSARAPIVVASKPFGESRLLAEMFAQALERAGWDVERRLALGATAVLFEGLQSGAIDVYPEYTGTALMAVLKQPPDADPERVLATVRAEFAARWGMRWLAPLGFENTYALAVRRETAERHGLSTLTDLARAGAALTGGFSPDFTARADGLPGLAAAYGLELAAVRPMDPALKYRALTDGAVDVVDGYSTDGEIDRLGLVVLTDDRGFFPPYQACALLGPAAAQSGCAAVLARLSGRIPVERIRHWNAVLAAGERTVEELARDALAESAPAGAAETGRVPAGLRRSSSASTGARIARHTLEHLALVAVALACGCALAIPLGVLLERRRRWAEHVVRATGVLQTVPSLALLALLIPLLGIGWWPALLALFLYTLFPIVRATYTGVREADPAACAAATACGMTPGQVLRHVRLPLAAPIILSGVRTAAVVTVGTATLATFVGAGGLGEPIQEGLSMLDDRLILMGAVPAALLALAVDGALALVERAVRPPV
jgi:osmoprotectant transport system permease protein